MTRRIQKFLLTLVAIGALAFGGATFANAVSSPSQSGDPPAKTAPAAAEQPDRESTGDKPDTDNVQDQSSPDTPDQGGKEAAEQSGKEGTGEQPGSEVPNDDGPGGHADEPGNPGADHQFQGEE